MSPEITIKISFVQGSGAGDETVAFASLGGAEVAPPELAHDPAGGEISAPLATEDEAYDSDSEASDIAPPSLEAFAEEPAPPFPTGEDMEPSESSGETATLSSVGGAEIDPP